MTGLARNERVALVAVGGVVAAAAVLHYAGAPDLLAFAAATLALAGLAWLVSFATQQVGQRFGPAVTGVLQSTLGNLPEFSSSSSRCTRARSSSPVSRSWVRCSRTPCSCWGS